jgi:hypothetical protein
MKEISRIFPLQSPSIWPAVLAFIKANWAVCKAAGKPLRVEITNRRQRTSPQNRYFHGPCLDAIATQAWVNGQRFSKEAWKEHFRRQYLLKGERMLPNGDVVPTYWSTAELSDEKMADFLTRVQAEAASEWGVIFDECG